MNPITFTVELMDIKPVVISTQEELVHHVTETLKDKPEHVPSLDDLDSKPMWVIRVAV